jgi:GT2 family glycosyltransferase
VSKICVLVLNWNGWYDTVACLRSLSDVLPEGEVWLIDNASVEDRTSEACAAYPGLRVLALNDNYGWAGGYNAALRIALREDYEYVYLLNNDCTVGTNFLSVALEAIKGDAQLATVGSTVLLVDELSPRAHLDHSCISDARINTREPMVRLIDTTSGAGMLVRMQAVKDLGFFDERFFCYYEEAEWCFRAREHGWRIALANKSIVYHRERGSDLEGNAAYYMARNQFLFGDLVQDPGAPRPLWKFICFYRGFRIANAARRAGRRNASLAVASGMWDALTGKYGKRGSRTPPRLFTYVVSHFWVFPPGFFRHKIRYIKTVLHRLTSPRYETTP